jgi:DNA-binding CsgD family transcriptional regulator
VTFLGVAVFAAVDISADLHEGTSLGHVVGEAGILLVALLGTIFMARRLAITLRRARAAQEEVLALAEQLEATRLESRRWQSEARELMQGLGAALDTQFDRWQLSPAEKEVALLLLKGLSHREIANIRAVTEATARQQARAVYKKAGLSGRNGLAGFFLEDLMLPIESNGDERSAEQSRAR